MNQRPVRDLPGIIGSALFILVGIAALYYSRDFTKLGAVFPRTMGSAMIVFAIAYIALALLRPAPPAAVEQGSWTRRILLVVAMLAWALLLNEIGFLTSSVLCFAVILLIANYDRWTLRMALTYLVVGAIVLGGVYSVFRFGLQVPLPTGLLI